VNIPDTNQMRADAERLQQIARASLMNTDILDLERIAGRLSGWADALDVVLAVNGDARIEADGAYHERNQVVAALAKCFPSGTARTAIEGWDPEWHGCVYIDLPTGQVSWHYHDSQADLFAFLPPYTKGWDGHDTPEKYRRLAALPLCFLLAPPQTIAPERKRNWAAPGAIIDPFLPRDEYIVLPIENPALTLLAELYGWLIGYGFEDKPSVFNGCIGRVKSFLAEHGK
jgi:hypothetical protein